jgi:K+-transporting ATPase c subunit
MKRILSAFTIIALFAACTGTADKINQKLDLLKTKAASLDSMVSAEAARVQQLDSIIYKEVRKVQQLDSIIEKEKKKWIPH